MLQTPASGGRPSRSFALVLGGGGVRGFTHVGVLRALGSMGHEPAAIAGVSMGAVVGAAYGLRHDWYEALTGLDMSRFPDLMQGEASPSGVANRMRALVAKSRALIDLVLRWGVGQRALALGMEVLRDLYGNHRLEEARIPLAICSTDLISGRRVVKREGPAIDAVYASMALAGVLPPFRDGDRLLADGAYADVAPIDVARSHADVVIAVDPGQLADAPDIKHGIHAIVRATEICFQHHAHLRFADADLVIRPEFPRYIDTLEFGAMQTCVEAGARAVDRQRLEIVSLLGERHAT